MSYKVFFMAVVSFFQGFSYYLAVRTIGSGKKFDVLFKCISRVF